MFIKLVFPDSLLSSPNVGKQLNNNQLQFSHTSARVENGTTPIHQIAGAEIVRYS